MEKWQDHLVWSFCMFVHNICMTSWQIMTMLHRTGKCFLGIFEVFPAQHCINQHQPYICTQSVAAFNSSPAYGDLNRFQHVSAISRSENAFMWKKRMFMDSFLAFLGTPRRIIVAFLLLLLQMLQLWSSRTPLKSRSSVFQARFHNPRASQVRHCSPAFTTFPKYSQVNCDKVKPVTVPALFYKHHNDIKHKSHHVLTSPPWLVGNKIVLHYCRNDKGEHDLHGFHCVLMCSLRLRGFVPAKWNLAFWSLRPIPAAYLSVRTIRCEFDFARFMHWLDAQTPQKEMYFNIIPDDAKKGFIYYRSWHVLAIFGVSMTSRFVDAVQAED